MPEVGQIKYSLREVTALMLKDQGIREGLWMLWTRFNFSATNIQPPEGEEGPSGPGAIAMISETGIQKADRAGPLAVDAAEIWNDAVPEKKAKARRPVAK